MPHIVESCPLTKLNGGLSQLHSADDAATAWLTNIGLNRIRKKKKKIKLTKTLLDDRSFAVTGPRIWNTLPVSLRVMWWMIVSPLSVC